MDDNTSFYNHIKCVVVVVWVAREQWDRGAVTGWVAGVSAVVRLLQGRVGAV